eukprot:PITA_12291
MSLHEIQLRSGKVVTQPRIIEEIVEEDTIEMPKVKTTLKKIEQPTSRPQEPSSSHMIQPPFPERLGMKLKQLKFDLVYELRNVCIKIMLLQEIKNIPIYAKIVREICTRRQGRQQRELSTIQVGGNLAAINVMPMDTLSRIGTFDLLPTPTMLELAEMSKVKPEGVLEDIVISSNSWKYPADFYVLQPKNNLRGNTLILGRPWLAMTDAYIGCRSRNTTITHGTEIKHINFYPLLNLS